MSNKKSESVNPRQKLVDRGFKHVRVIGEQGSETNELRHQLYKLGFERIKTGLQEERYFEVVMLSDSIITDRLNAVVQFTRRDEETDFPHQSVGSMLAILQIQVKENLLELSSDLISLIKKIDGEWVEKRNFVAHSFVLVTNKSKDKSVEDRLNLVKECAVEGAVYSRQITDMVDKFLRAQHKKIAAEQ